MLSKKSLFLKAGASLLENSFVNGFFFCKFGQPSRENVVILIVFLIKFV